MTEPASPLSMPQDTPFIDNRIRDEIIDEGIAMNVRKMRELQGFECKLPCGCAVYSWGEPCYYDASCDEHMWREDVNLRPTGSGIVQVVGVDDSLEYQVWIAGRLMCSCYYRESAEKIFAALIPDRDTLEATVADLDEALEIEEEVSDW